MRLADAAARAGVSAATLRRWARLGLISRLGDSQSGAWTPGAVAQARVIARMRARGHTLREISEAARDGRLEFGVLDDLFPPHPRRRTVAQAARAARIGRRLARRLMRGFGISPAADGTIGEDDVSLLRHAAAALEAGLPEDALVQLARVYGHAMSSVADAEVRLVHLYVHEPLMRSGAGAVQVAEQLDQLNRGILPLAGPVLELLHRRQLRFFAEQDAVSHIEADAVGEGGRMRVAIAFADLAGYTRMTEEQGEHAAVDAVERFLGEIDATLPDGARVVKTIGDAAMVIAADARPLAEWAIRFARGRQPAPRIALHAGWALYRDGDWFGRDVNIAARLAGRAREGEVLVTGAVAEGLEGAGTVLEPRGATVLRGVQGRIEVLAASVEEPPGAEGSGSAGGDGGGEER